MRKKPILTVRQCADCGTDVMRTGTRGQIANRCPKCQAAHQRLAMQNWKRKRLAEGPPLARKDAPTRFFFCAVCGNGCSQATGGRHRKHCEICGSHNESSRRYKSERTPERVAEDLEKAAAERRARRGDPCCLQCGAPLGKGRSKFCGPSCTYKHGQEANHIAWLATWEESECLECGETFKFPPVKGQPRLYCTPKCCKRNHDRRRTRARRAATQTLIVFEFDPIEVLIRDVWKCRHCGVATPREKRGSFDPDAPEVDHILPLSRGGAHEIENCQCLCRECNARKANRTQAEFEADLPMPPQQRWGKYHRGPVVQIEMAL